MLGLLGLLSAMLGAVHQVLRLWQWREAEAEKEDLSHLAEEVDALEAQIQALSARLERLQNKQENQEAAS